MNQAIYLKRCPLCHVFPSMHEQAASAACMNETCGMYGNWIELEQWNRRPGEAALQRDLELALDAVVKLDPVGLGEFRTFLAGDYGDWREIVYLTGEADRLRGRVTELEAELDKMRVALNEIYQMPFAAEIHIYLPYILLANMTHIAKRALGKHLSAHVEVEE